MEAGGPGSRKRKSAAPDAPAATEEPDTEPTTGDQGPPPGLDDGRAEDHISHLPDAVLGDIISLLPTKDGARTQVLASRYRHLWRSAPLNLDQRDLRVDKHALDGVVSRILSAHAGPGRRFCAPVSHLLRDRAATADAWLLSPALNDLQELELCWYDQFLQFPYKQPFPPEVPLPPPAPAFRFSRTLRVATIGDCHLSDGIAQGLQFPNLKQLALGQVKISECSLQCMIAGCPALECLLIHHSFGFRCLRINSLTLRGVGVRNSPLRIRMRFEELIIENAPCLERLLALGGNDGLHISVISAPKLETLGCLSDTTGHLSTSLVFGSTIIQAMHVHSPTTKVCTVKILAIGMNTLSLDAVINLMRCFPCLEKLYIESIASGETNLWLRKHQNLVKCLDIRLKTIVWRYYRGTKSHVNFAKFFIHNAKVLELMRFQVRPEHYNEESFALQRERLQLERKASRDAKLIFTPYGSHRNAMFFRVHDLDLTDPFIRTDPFSTRLVFGSTIIQAMRVDSLTTGVCTVKILAVNMNILSPDEVIDLMRFFPCLEKMYIESIASGEEKNLWPRKHQNLIKCPGIRLKTIVWRYYRTSHVNFATFFIRNAEVLELMRFQVRPEHYYEESFAQQREMLQLERKASRDAKLIFTPDGSHRDAMFFRVHDLDLTDPFILCSVLVPPRT